MLVHPGRLIVAQATLKVVEADLLANTSMQPSACWTDTVVDASGMQPGYGEYSVLCGVHLKTNGNTTIAQQAAVLEPPIGTQAVEVVLLMVLQPSLIIEAHLALIGRPTSVKEVDRGDPVRHAAGAKKKAHLHRS